MISPVDKISHSEEVQEIIGRPPRFIVRSGISILFLFLILGFSFSYFFKIPVMISSSFVMNVENPNVQISIERDGVIQNWLVMDGEFVQKDQVIGIIDYHIAKDSLPELQEAHLISPCTGELRFTEKYKQQRQINSGETIGYVLSPGELRIYAWLQIPPMEIRNVDLGQSVILKLSSFPYLEYEALKGSIVKISDVPQNGLDGLGMFYFAKVHISQAPEQDMAQKLRYFSQLEGSADILLGEVRLISRLFQVLEKVLNRN